MKNRPRILMCAPHHFDVTYAINPWMHDVAVDNARAREQWRRLHAALAAHADIELLTPIEGLPDLPFTANAGTLRGSVFVPTRFRHPERRGEEPHYTGWFRRNGYDVRELPPGVISEGAGDALVDVEQGCLWMGYGPRSDLRAAAALGDLLDLEVVPLELIDPRFYHLDTCFCPLPGGGAMYHPGAFDRAGLRAIERRVPRARRIPIQDHEARAFACNSVILGDRIFMNRASPRLESALARFGLRVEAVALDEFLKAGGSARCLTLRLDVPARVDEPELRQIA